MAVPTVYRWDDINAPQITDMQSPTQLDNFLQKIFVDGYLENDGVTHKAGLGWTKTTMSSVRFSLEMVGNPVTENLMTVEVESPNGQGFLGMKTKVISDGQIIVDNNLYNTLFGGYSIGGRIAPWVVIGTTRGFYMMCGANSLTTVGDIPPFSDTVNYATMMYVGQFVNDGAQISVPNAIMGIGQLADNLHPHTEISTKHDDHTYGTSGIIIGRDYLDVANITECYHYEHVLGDSSTTTFVGNPRVGLKFPYIDGKIYLKEFGLYGNNDGVYYGRLPALYYPEHKKPYANASNFVEFTGAGDFAGDEFLGISTTDYNEMYVNTSEDWGF